MDLDIYYKLISSDKRSKIPVGKKLQKLSMLFLTLLLSKTLSIARRPLPLFPMLVHLPGLLQTMDKQWMIYRRAVAVDRHALREPRLSGRNLVNRWGVSYRTVYGAVCTIRAAILGQSENGFLSGAVELDETYFDGRRKGLIRMLSQIDVLQVGESEGRSPEDFFSGKVDSNSREGFCSLAEERLIKHHGVSKTHFSLYLKEMEFR